MFISQIKYSQCEVLTAKFVFSCLGQVKFPLLNCSLYYPYQLWRKQKLYCTKLMPEIHLSLKTEAIPSEEHALICKCFPVSLWFSFQVGVSVWEAQKYSLPLGDQLLSVTH